MVWYIFLEIIFKKIVTVRCVRIVGIGFFSFQYFMKSVNVKHSMFNCKHMIIKLKTKMPK